MPGARRRHVQNALCALGTLGVVVDALLYVGARFRRLWAQNEFTKAITFLYTHNLQHVENFHTHGACLDHTITCDCCLKFDARM